MSSVPPPPPNVTPPPPTNPSAAGAVPPPPPPAAVSAPAPAQAPGAVPPPPPPPAEEGQDGPRVVRTDVDASDGLTKCPRCGATEVSLNTASGRLRCHFCRFEWQSVQALEHYGIDKVGELTGLVLGSGASRMESTEDVRTFTCSACGADVVIDTEHSTQARCHWCRNVLSMNQQIPNGAVPDMILPFSVPKQAAIEKISAFVKKRQFFAHPRFKKEFAPENVMGVYLPYMVVDVNAKASMSGVGEHEARRYTVKVGDNNETRYDVDIFQVGRQFDLHVNDLTVESSSSRLNQRTSENTNNIINSIMPFDTVNAVRYDSNYLSGFTMEKRDTDYEHLLPLAQLQVGDIARHQANATLQHYDRGVRWDHEELQIVGQRWLSAYLPVWLYSYYERKKDGSSFLHYVAVNGRTGETMGSVPINKPRLLAVSAVVQVIGMILGTIILVVG